MNFITLFISLASLFCAAPVDWNRLQHIIASGDLALLSRSQDNLDRYLELKDALKDAGMTMPDYVREKIFGFSGEAKHEICQVQWTAMSQAATVVYIAGPEATWRQFIKQAIKCTPRQGIQQRSQFVLLAANDFPYQLELIHHWVIWSSAQLPPPTRTAFLAQLLHPNVQALNFENPHEIKSIPEISHYHLFWKKQSDLDNDL